MGLPVEGATRAPLMKPVYKRMIEKMQVNEEKIGLIELWHLYILECSDGTLYTGVTKDINRRIDQHNTGKGARYTRTRAPVKLVYHEECVSHSKALIRECAIKALPREQKKLLIVRSSFS